MITIRDFSDPYFRITCCILIKSLQLFGMPFQNLFANKWNLACRTTNIWLLISDTLSIFQTNAGNIILTSSKLHIRAVHHTLSEIGTKRWFGYQGIAIRRNYKGQKSLIEANWKHGFDLKKADFHIQLFFFFLRRCREHYLFPLWPRQMVGPLPISPMTMTQAPL